ncbi:MAG: hypothetical protein B1H07_04965 [Campylobacteraceae bacterium 4484_166]|nr:MAG: hypothetical protein B1H07_04965 [Campylobacteraceae bacterium 4484_166]
MIYFLIFIFIEVMISSQFIAMLGGLMTFLQFSISTYIFKPFFSFKENRTHRSYQSNFRYNETNLNKRKNDEIIDVEVIDDTKHIVS